MKRGYTFGLYYNDRWTNDGIMENGVIYDSTESAEKGIDSAFCANARRPIRIVAFDYEDNDRRIMHNMEVMKEFRWANDKIIEVEIPKLKYIKTSYLNKWFTFEHEGEQFTEELYGVTESVFEMKGYFQFQDKEYLLHKLLHDSEDEVKISIVLENVKSRLDKAYIYGLEAFKKGMKSIPAMDRNFLEDIIRGCGVGDCTKYLLEWRRGWNDANLN